ncbi:MAG: hypothetical protein ABI699_15845 [Caldimonas sp.]
MNAMRSARWTLLLALPLALACQAGTAGAIDLIDAWQAAVQNDRIYAVGRAAQATAQPRRDQAAALWKPSVGLTTSLGVGTSETDTRGAQFSAPGLGQSSGVGFNTSVTNGTSGRVAVTATQPLSRDRR